VDRSELCGTFRIDESVWASSDRWAAGVAGPDLPSIVIEAAGHQAGTLTDAVNAVAPGGLVYYFGIPDDAQCAFDISTFLRKSLTLKAGITRHRRQALAAAERYARGAPELGAHFTSHVFPLDEAETAFTMADRPSRGQIKIAVTPHPDIERAQRIRMESR
jgi:threonine dehydrogenase-like Zn-dependent dehydrogenase